MERPDSFRPSPVNPPSTGEQRKSCLLCKDDPLPPVYLCAVCKIPLCAGCYQGHVSLQRYAGHRSVPYVEITWCPTHLKRQVLFCENCQESCCIICANYGFHQGHAVLDKQATMQRLLNKELEECEQLRQQVYSTLFSRVETYREQLQELTDSEAKLVQIIRNQANILRHETDSLYSDAKVKLEELAKHRASSTVEEMQTYHQELQRCDQELPDQLKSISPFEVNYNAFFDEAINPSAEAENLSSIIKKSDFVVESEERVEEEDQEEAAGLNSEIDIVDPPLNSSALPEESEPLTQILDDCIYMLCNESDKIVRFDMCSEHWDMLTSDRPWPKFCNFTMIDPRTLIVTGGGHVPSKKTFELDLTSLTSREQHPMISPRNHHGLIMTELGVLAIGGLSKHIQAKCELFELETREWREVGLLNNARAAFGVCKITDLVYVFGGWDGRKEIDTIETFSLREEKWNLLLLHLPLESQCNAVVADNRILVFAFKPGKIYEVGEETVKEFGTIMNEAWCRPELTLYRNKVFSFRSGMLKVVKYDLGEKKFSTTILSVEEPN